MTVRQTAVGHVGPASDTAPTLSVADTARALGLSRGTLKNWLAAADPKALALRPFKNPAGRWRFPADVVAAAVTRAQQDAAGQARPATLRVAHGGRR